MINSKKNRKWIKIAFAILILILFFPWMQVIALRFYNPATTSWMKLRAAEAKKLGKPYQVKHTWIPLQAISPNLKNAVIAAEDDLFYTHSGFNWDAMQAAWKKNENADKIKRGGSTMTQQLAKNLYLSPKRSYIRKAREAWITVALELFLPKDRILEIYLNSIEWGTGVFGAEEGAKYHFGISASKLNLDQACKMAAIIPSPHRYKPGGAYVTGRAQALMKIVGG